MVRLLVLPLLLLVACQGPAAVGFRLRRAPRESGSCGYASCPAYSDDPEVLNVHLVPHSHDDVGWLKTVDQYFFGARDDIQHAGVQYIIDSVISELLLDPSKRFIQVETGFYFLWWNEQMDEMKETVRDLVNEGRLEIAGGGWSMSDEATSHYSAFVDNMAIGLNTLKATLGDCGVPKVAWQIDPFGHSREEASLFAQMGFDSLFFARIDERERTQRKTEHTLELLWEGTDHLGESTSLFTGVFPVHYHAPDGFCFDSAHCDDPPIMDDPNIEEYNLKGRLLLFTERVQEHRQHFSQGRRHIMFTMGQDFDYENAHHNFKNMDKLIKHMNNITNETNINVLYSTPSCYALALNQDGDGTLNRIWTTKTDDFFPYCDEKGKNNYWTGYFTSRPSFKYHERQSNALLQSAKQVNAISGDERQGEGVLLLAEAMGISQHHDAITGTAKSKVDDDYNYRLA